VRDPNHIRLDRFAVGNGGFTSASTALIAEEGSQAINWGNASHRGDLSPIVTVKIGFLSVTVDEDVVGRDKLCALRDSYHFKARERREKLHAAMQTSATNRFEAAVAAVLAGQYVVACETNPSVVFNMVVVIVLREFAQQLTPEHIVDILKAAESAGADCRREGYAKAKEELRRWLHDDFGGVWSA
jgi:hypothetical protein